MENVRSNLDLMAQRGIGKISDVEPALHGLTTLTSEAIRARSSWWRRSRRTWI
jgi:hypothetical protein